MSLIRVTKRLGLACRFKKLDLSGNTYIVWLGQGAGVQFEVFQDVK